MPFLDEHLRPDALALGENPQEDVFGSDVVVAETESFVQRQLENLLGSRRERRLAALADPRRGTDGLNDELPRSFETHLQ